MREPVWRLTAWYLQRALTPQQYESALGDLAEDFSRRERTLGPIPARLWLVRESASLVRAYRSCLARERRQSRRLIMGGTCLEDMRFAVRRLTKSPGATAASIVALACGIAGAAVTWSLLTAVLLRPVAVAAPDRLFLVTAEYQQPDGQTRTSQGYVYPVYQAIRDAGAFAGLAAGGPANALVAERGAIPQPRRIEFVSHDFFATLGVAVRGRDFTPADDQRGAPVAAILSDRYWRQVFGADADVLGETIRVADIPATIVGIAPRPFRGLNVATPPDLYLPLHTVGDVTGPNSNYFAEPVGSPPVRDSPYAWIRVVGRLSPDWHDTDAAARLNSALAADGRVTYRLLDIDTAAVPEFGRDGLTQFGRLLAITVGLLLLIGCVTVGMLLLVRTEARRGELAMCLALGGTRLGLVRGIVFEGALLSAAAALLAVPIAWWVFNGIGAFTLPGRIEVEALELGLDGRTIAGMAATAGVATLLASLVGGAFAFSPNLARMLRMHAAGSTRVTRRRTRTTLVAAQVAVAVILLTGAGLLSRSLTMALTLNAGFDASRIVTATIPLRQYGYTPERAQDFFESLRARLASHPGIESLSLIRNEGAMTTSGQVVVDGLARQFPSRLSYVAVDDRYFPTMGMRILEGRNFSSDDTLASPLALIVSQSLGREIAGTGSPIGHRITETSARLGEAPAVGEIVGVVPDVITNVTDTSPLVKYYAIHQRNLQPAATLVMRTGADPARVMGDTVSVIISLDPLVTPPATITIEDQLRQQMSAQDLGQFVLGGLGVVAALLTLLGAYALAETMSAGRRREFTIRRALGASSLHVSGLVLADGLRIVGIGLCAGLALAWAGSGTIRAFLYRVDLIDPTVLAGVAAGILVVTQLVSLKPALEAGRVDLTSLARDE